MSNNVTRPIDRAIAAGEREFRELADFAPVMIWRAGADRQADWFNRPWLEFTGRDLVDEVGDGWVAGVHPDDVERCHETYVRAFEAREAFTLEYRLRRRDGVYRWIVENGAPFTRQGEFAGYWGSGTDITGHRSAESSQRVLINELNHRLKNTLTVVQAVAERTFREDRPVGESLAAFSARLRALANTQDRLLATAWEDVAIRDVVKATVAPFDDGQSRIRHEGPAMVLRASTASALTMALHELLTNAVKYGALSHPDGAVDIAWHCAPGDRECRLRFTWKERGGPAVTVPLKRGFGTRFVERGMAGEPGGVSELSFEPDGVHWLLETSLPPNSVCI